MITNNINNKKICEKCDMLEMKKNKKVNDKSVKDKIFCSVHDEKY